MATNLPVPPNEEQITNMREYASQLEYAFRARPRPGTEGRASWEKRFMGTFGRLLKVLGSAHFTHIPPFAIACIWENNRRSYIDKNQPFNPELIGDAYDPAHPAYHAGNGHLIYKAAYEGPFAAIPEDQLRSVWWTQRIGAAATANTLHQPAHGAGHGATSSGATGAASGSLGEAMEVDVEGPVESADAASDPSKNREGSRGRAVAKAALPNADGGGQVTRRTTRSTSRPRPTPATAGSSKESAAAPSKKASKTKGKAKAKETTSRQLAPTNRAMSSVDNGSSEAVQTSGKGKGSRTGRRGPADEVESSGTLTLEDITPETIPTDDVPHPRPCTRCVSRDEICMFNPLVRPGCMNCDQGNAKCTLTFYNKRDHVMTAYLGYAWYRMLTNPAVFAPPNFSPAQYPSWVPHKKDIAWYEKQYREFRRTRTSSRGSSKKASAATSHTSDAEQLGAESDGEGDVLTDAASIAQSEDEDVEDVDDTGSAKSDNRRSRSASSAASRTSVTLPGSPVASTSTLPASPVGTSTVSTEAPGVDRSAISDIESDRSTRAMSIDGDGMGGPHEPVDSSTVPVEREKHGDARQSSKPTAGPSAKLAERSRTVVAPPPAVEPVKISKLPDELVWDSATRWSPPPMPPALPGSSKCIRHPLAVNSISETWEDLPRLSQRVGSGVYALTGPPHSNNASRRIQELLSMTRPDIDVLARLGGAAAPYDTPPSTPELESFDVTRNIVALAQDAKVRYDEIASLQESMTTDASALRQRAAALLPQNDGGSAARDNVAGETRDDVRAAFEYLAQAHEVLARVASAFGSIPAVPWNWGALFELLTKIEEMKELYQISWERFDMLEEHVRPVRKEMYQVRTNVAFIQGRIEGIVNESILACEVLLSNMYQHVDSRLSVLEQRLRRLDGESAALPRPLEATVGDLLAMITTLSARMDRLERATEDRTAPRMEAVVGKYLADRGLTDEVLEQLGERFGTLSMAVETGGSLSEAFNVVHPVPGGGEYPPPPATSAISSASTARRIATPAVGHASALTAASALSAAASTPLHSIASPPAHHTRARNPQVRGGRGRGQ